MCKSTWAFLSIKQPYFLLLVFSPFWGEIFLMDSRRKHLGPTVYFPSSPPNQTHSKKVFLLIFSSKFSINSISSPNKHTLKRINIARNFTNLPISSITILPLWRTQIEIWFWVLVMGFWLIISFAHLISHVYD